MNIQLDVVFNNVIHNNGESIPFILTSVSLDPEAVHLQMEETNQDIQDTNSAYFVNTYTTNTTLLDTSDETIKYIEELIHPLYSYPECPTNQDHINPDIRT